MGDLTKVEIQNIKMLIENSNLEYQKLNEYSCNVLNPQVKQFIDKMSQQALNTKQKMMLFLNN